MDSIASRLKNALSIRKMSQSELVRATRIGKSSISTYLSGDYEPKQKNIYKMAQALNVDEAWLMGYDVPMEKEISDKSLSEREKSLLKDYNVLNDKGKDRADERVHELTEIPRYLNDPEDNIIEFEFYEEPASAGAGLYLGEGTKSTISIKRTPETYKANFALKVRGDSMEPKFCDDDVILIKSVPCVDLGEFGIFVVNSEVFIKKFGGDKLISLNKKYSDILLYEEDAVFCLGKVVGKAEVVE